MHSCSIGISPNNRNMAQTYTRVEVIVQDMSWVVEGAYSGSGAGIVYGQGRGNGSPGC